MESFLVYGSMFCFSIFFANRAKKTGKKQYVWLIIFILSFVYGCRAKTVGYDTISYYNAFNGYLMNSKYIAADFEIGFEYLSRLVLKIIPNISFLFISYAVVIFALIVWRLWDFRNVAEFDWTIAFFLVVNFFSMENIMRQYIALAIVFWGTRFIEKKKYLAYLAIVALASIFHKTALLTCLSLLLELRLWKKLSIWNKSIIALCIAAGPIVAWYASKYYIDSYYERIISYSNSFSIGKRVYVDILLAVLALIAFEYDKSNSWRSAYRLGTTSSERLRRTDEELQHKLSSIKTFYMVGLFLNALGYMLSAFGRIGLYWYFYQSLCTGMLVNSKMNRSFFKLVIVIYMAYTIYGYTFGYGSGNGEFPYLFFWQV